MTDDDLIAHIGLLESRATGNLNDGIAAGQAKALQYYNTQPMGTEEEGRSQVISSDVWDVVEGLTPMIVKPFVANDDLVKFTPQGPEDVQAAEQETQYINYVVTAKNNAFETLVAWAKVGLLQKNGIVKYWWEKKDIGRIERYDAVPDDLYAMLLQDKSIRVIEHTETPSDDPNAPPTHDITVRIVESVGQPVYAVVPPEEFRIARNATSPDPAKADFVQHTPTMTISAIRQMGYDVPNDVSDNSTMDPRGSPTYIERHHDEVDGVMARNENGGDPSMREVIFKETYLRVDYDDDGIAELRKVCMVGTTVLSNEETEEIPFCAWTPILQPFKFHGKCPADETIQTQDVKSTLLRQTLDNIYGINNNRVYVGPEVNVDDYIDNQIGGLVRVGSADVRMQVREAPITPINAVTLPLLEVMDAAKENRTGWTRYNQGTDANSLNKTATGIRIINEASNERAGLMSRSLAEMGMKPLMLGIHRLCRRHATKAETIELRGEWVTIDPRSWRNRMDMSVSVGLGNADKQMQMQGAQMMLQEQKELLQLTGPGGLVTPKNLFEAAARLANSVGEKNPELFFTMPKQKIDPKTGRPMPEGPPAPPDPMQDPEVMFKLADHKLKEREVRLKEQDFELKRKQAHVAALSEFARMQHEQMPQAPATEPTEPAEAPEQEDKTMEELVQNQTAIMTAVGSLMDNIAKSNELLNAMLAEATKPKTVRVEKQADGSYLGIKEDA